MAERYSDFLPERPREFLMKTRPHIFAIHFSVIAFELFCPQLACLSEKLAALGYSLPLVAAAPVRPPFAHAVLDAAGIAAKHFLPAEVIMCDAI
ncbi:MAG: hypothetical protein ONB48_20570 [candidate division KSB1 bacterium]|nr:hypothetical protein [candidate division KSB1 bacterium]MDZ7273380.1 hypothetical protein [candidate division KSB1 bacterium]MDZ7288042.1 hypothetical protein [candidate division KSB1 bacterium]MDZ7300106.1 hypothetical protein [candidate division KSB1 bacterium]MDZ7307230.1 hypothetical protein [candidate division KSB1 bacterium]